ncbi:MAG TPA: hypothetical protein VGG39_31845 [Polyangiaceae bacterium]|jgi:hypothetical protein
MLQRTIILSLAVLPLALAGACSSASPQCHVGADCASGACGSNGQCLPATEADGGADAGHPAYEAGAEASVEAATEAAPGDDGGAGCVPDHDGVVTRAELPMLAGLHASFLIAENVTMTTGGVAQPDGSVDWDFSAALSGDHTVVITTDDPSGQWFASKYPGATYTSKLSDTQTLLGVYQATASALDLVGVVTPTNGAPVTEVSYSPSAEILAVPMQMGSTWTSTSQVTGTADGIAAIYSEKYVSSVDAHGSLKVPYGTFDVLRVQTTLTRTDGAIIETTQTMTFVAECFGPVARLTSKTTTYPQAVPGDAFTQVAEAWRLSP